MRGRSIISGGKDLFVAVNGQKLKFEQTTISEETAHRLNQQKLPNFTGPQ